ncbi:hypothetical protein D3C80_1051910 [compost metagenome]
MGQRLVHGGGDLLGEFGRVGVLRFGVQGHQHQVAGYFLADFGAQGNLVVAGLIGRYSGQAGEQAGTQGKCGAAAEVVHVKLLGDRGRGGLFHSTQTPQTLAFAIGFTRRSRYV